MTDLISKINVQIELIVSELNGLPGPINLIGSTCKKIKKIASSLFGGKIIKGPVSKLSESNEKNLLISRLKELISLMEKTIRATKILSRLPRYLDANEQTKSLIDECQTSIRTYVNKSKRIGQEMRHQLEIIRTTKKGTYR